MKKMLSESIEGFGGYEAHEYDPSLCAHIRDSQKGSSRLPLLSINHTLAEAEDCEVMRV